MSWYKSDKLSQSADWCCQHSSAPTLLAWFAPLRLSPLFNKHEKCQTETKWLFLFHLSSHFQLVSTLSLVTFLSLKNDELRMRPYMRARLHKLTLDALLLSEGSQVHHSELFGWSSVTLKSVSFRSPGTVTIFRYSLETNFYRIAFLNWFYWFYWF